MNNQVKRPICPFNMYFEGDENKCDMNKCDYSCSDRSCSGACQIKDTKMIKTESGKEREFNSGAKRQHAEGKGTPVLFPGDAYLEVCKHFEGGAVHYGGRNWEKGLPLSSYIDSLERHIAQEKMGLTDESHDRAIAWNAICYLATKLRIQAGILPAELADLCGVYGKEVPRHAEVRPKFCDACEEKISKAKPGEAILFCKVCEEIRFKHQGGFAL